MSRTGSMKCVSSLILLWEPVIDTTPVEYNVCLLLTHAEGPEVQGTIDLYEMPKRKFSFNGTDDTDVVQMQDEIAARKTVRATGGSPVYRT